MILGINEFRKMERVIKRIVREITKLSNEEEEESEIASSKNSWEELLTRDEEVEDI